MGRWAEYGRGRLNRAEYGRGRLNVSRRWSMRRGDGGTAAIEDGQEADDLAGGMEIGRWHRSGRVCLICNRT